MKAKVKIKVETKHNILIVEYITDHVQKTRRLLNTEVERLRQNTVKNWSKA